MKSVYILILCFLLTACGGSAVIITTKEIKTLETPPDYQVHLPYFFLGLIKPYHIDIHKVCGPNETVIQMKDGVVGKDGLLALLTVWTYTPRTLQVWCEPIAEENTLPESHREP